MAAALEGTSNDLPGPARLSVGIIAPPWLPVPPVGYGGTENVLDVLARGLQEAGHDVTLFTTGDATCAVPREWRFARALGVGTGSTIAEARHVVAAYRRLRGLDVIHDHTLLGPLACRFLTDLPVVCTNHNLFDDDLRAAYGGIATRAPVVAISHHQASTAGGVPVAAVIHHGIDLREVPVGTGNGGYAAFLGRMHPDKGVDLAIRAARSAGVPLRIAAKMTEPVEHEFFAARVAPQLGPDVEYLGEVDQQAKFELLGAACCLLNPVRWAEPFGMVMIEALACGTPVVSSRAGSAPEIVEPGVTGFLCRDHDDLVEALARTGTILRARCRAAVEERFSAARMVAAHVSLYRQVLGAHQVREARLRQVPGPEERFNSSVGVP